MGQPLLWNSPQELRDEIQAYYNWCEEKDKHITVTGLAWYLKTNRQSLINYENCEENGWLKRCSEEEKKEYVDAIREAKTRIEMEYENSLFSSSSVTGAKFTLSNNYNWKDKQVVENTNKEITVDIIDDEE